LTRNELIEEIKKKRSFLCIGLDTGLKKNSQSIFTILLILYLNSTGASLIRQRIYALLISSIQPFMNPMVQKVGKVCKERGSIFQKVFLPLLMQKRGDIGNTSALYANAFFNRESSGLGFDAITVKSLHGRGFYNSFSQL
jgi:orotidine-5'-phosphate decarboxylase